MFSSGSHSSDMDEIKRWMNNMGFSSNDPPPSILLEPEFHRFVMHISRNTLPAKVATKIQKNCLRDQLKEDIPQSQFPLQVHMDSQDDVIRYQLLKDEKCSALNEQIKANLEVVKAFQGNQGQKQAESVLNEHFQLCEYYMKRAVAAKQMSCTCQNTNAFIQKILNHIRLVLKQDSSEQKPNPNFPQSSKVWKLEKLAEMNNFIEQLKRFRESFRMIYCNKIEPSLLEMPDMEQFDKESEDMFSRCVALSKEIFTEMPTGAEGRLVNPLPPQVKNIKQTLTSLVSEDHKMSDVGVSIKLTQDIMETVDLVKMLQLEFTEKLQNLISLLTKDPTVNKVLKKKDFKTAKRYEEVLNNFVQASNDPNDPSFLQEQTLNDTLDVSVDNTFGDRAPIDELIKTIEETTEKLLKVVNDLRYTNDMKLKFAIKCLEECHSKKVGDSNLSKIITDFLSKLEYI